MRYREYMPSGVERTSTSDSVFRKLRSAILSGELQQGSLHSIYEFAEKYEVSRTPVREAVLRLADTGMAKKRGQSENTAVANRSTRSGKPPSK